MVNRSTISVYSASVAGTSHLRRGIERQDRVCHRTQSGFLVSAVSDGAGSARNSALGAAVTTSRAVTFATWRLLDLAGPPSAGDLEGILKKSAASARQSLEALSCQTGEVLGSYANTLLLAIQTDTLLGAAQVGDGGIVISNEGGGFDCLTSPQRGEYANETTFITSRDGLEQLEVRVLRPSQGIWPCSQTACRIWSLKTVPSSPFSPFLTTSSSGWNGNRTRYGRRPNFPGCSAHLA